MMLLARIANDLVEAAIDGPRRATAPCCGVEVIAKTGTIVSAHWAHHQRADCDPWSEPESDWHLGWKRAARAAGAAVEVPFRVGDKIVHRADIVLADGRIVEVQRSPLAIDRRREREDFYGARGGMFWIIDGNGWEARPRKAATDPYGLGSAMPWVTKAFGAYPDIIALFGRHRVTLDSRAPQLIDLPGGPAWKRKAIHVRAYGETWIGLDPTPPKAVFASPGPAYRADGAEVGAGPAPGCVDPANHRDVTFTTSRYSRWGWSRHCRICTPLEVARVTDRLGIPVGAAS